MPTKSIKFPIQVTGSGGLATVTGDDELQQTVKLNFLSGESSSPWVEFEDVGLRHKLFFRRINATTQAIIKNRVKAKLQRMINQKRIKTDLSTLRFTKDEAGILKLRIGYLNLETNKVEEYEQAFSAG